MSLLDNIKKEIAQAEMDRKKYAMFLYKVLVNAQQLRGEDPEHFCAYVNVPKTYATEFRKMMAVAALMDKMGKRIR
jgi:hypothetical protein